MNETVFLALHHLRVVWHHRWIALSMAAFLSLSGWFVVMTIPNQYLVTAKVYLDTSTSLKPLLRGIAADTNMQRDAAMMVQKTLLTRPTLETVARKVDLDLKAKTPRDFDLIIDKMQKSITITPTDRNNIFVVSYENHDPKLAMRVVSALLNTFVERSLGASRKDTSTSKEFLDKQIHAFEQRLADAENRLREFKQKNVGLMPSQGKDYFSELQDVESQLANAELQLNEAERRRDELKAQLSGEQPAFGFGPDANTTQSVTTPLDSRIDALQKQLDDLRLKYTDQYPDVIATKRLIAELKKQREAVVSKDNKGSTSGPTPVEANPVYQDFKVSLGQAQANVAALKARVDEYKKREANLKKLVNTVPQIEAELESLNRNYDIDKKNYKELVARREALSLTQQANQSSDDFQFNVIEPPRVPLFPVSPNRQMLSIGALVVGLGGGIAFAWLLGLLRPTFYSSENFAEVTDFPVLGTVSRIWTRREAMQRRIALASFAAGVVGLFGLYGGLMVLQTVYGDLFARLPDLAQHLPDLAGRIL